MSRERGGALIVGLLMLVLISTLSIVAAGAAHLELQLARNVQFRENASAAATAGIESAISRIVSSTMPESALTGFSASLPDIDASFEVRVRLLGLETNLPQAPGANLAAAHVEIISTGLAQRGAFDRQRAIIARVIEAAAPVPAAACAPEAAGIPCVAASQWRRVSWHRLPRE